MEEKDKKLYEKIYTEIRDITKLPQEIRDKLDEKKRKGELEKFSLYLNNTFFKNQ